MEHGNYWGESVSVCVVGRSVALVPSRSRAGKGGGRGCWRLHKGQWAMVTGQTPGCRKPDLLPLGYPVESQQEAGCVDWKLTTGERLRVHNTDCSNA